MAKGSGTGSERRWKAHGIPCPVCMRIERMRGSSCPACEGGGVIREPLDSLRMLSARRKIIGMLQAMTVRGSGSPDERDKLLSALEGLYNLEHALEKAVGRILREIGDED